MIVASYNTPPSEQVGADFIHEGPDSTPALNALLPTAVGKATWKVGDYLIDERTLQILGGDHEFQGLIKRVDGVSSLNPVLELSGDGSSFATLRVDGNRDNQDPNVWEWDAVHILNLTNSTFTSPLIERGGRHNLLFENSHSNTLTDVSAHYAHYNGIYFLRSNDNRVYGYNAHDNVGAAVFYLGCSGNYVEDTTSDYNMEHIAAFSDAHNNTMKGIKGAMSRRSGFAFYSSTGNVIEDYTVKDCARLIDEPEIYWANVYFSTSQGNILRNGFIEDTPGVSLGAYQVWEVSGGPNYLYNTTLKGTGLKGRISMANPLSVVEWKEVSSSQVSSALVIAAIAATGIWFFGRR